MSDAQENSRAGLRYESSADVQSRDPITGHVWATFPTATSDEVKGAIASARHAQPAWGALTVAERVKLLSNAAKKLYKRRDEVARVISRENGKPMVEAVATEVVTTLDIFRYYIRNAGSVLEPERSGSASLALWRKRITVSREPHGVVAVIAPWNYPFMLPAGIVAPALVAGNAVVLKPSELTPSSAVLLRELFLEAGLDPALLSVVQGSGETGRAVVDGAIDKVFFTGSVATGRRVAHACAERLIPCVLELGGSDPALVLADADVDHAASGILWGRFSNCGQTCVAPKRVFVADAIYERFVAALEGRIQGLQMAAEQRSSDILPDGGHGPFDIGALIRVSQRESLDALRDDALGRGARVSVGARGRSAVGGSHFAPTLLLQVPPDARALREETFGPLLPIVRVRDEEEMIALANDSDFGLSASIWTRSRDHGRELARRLEAGTVVINDVALSAGVAEVPHGGVKQSGNGRAHGIAGLEECVRTKTVVEDILPTWRQAWWFGYGLKSLARMDGYVRLAHATTIRERLSGVASTIALLFRPERPL